MASVYELFVYPAVQGTPTTSTFPNIRMGICFSKFIRSRKKAPTVLSTKRLTNNQNDGDESDYYTEFAGGNVALITTKDAWDQKLSEAKREHKVVIANFSASWCGPCRMIAPYYIELSEKHSSLMFLTVDVDELTDLSMQWDIKATPTFFFLRDGDQFDKLVGANKPELLKKINGIVDSEGRA